MFEAPAIRATIIVIFESQSISMIDEFQVNA